MERKLPDRAQVVVIGAGVGGCSVAYHLTKLGWRDVVVLERETLVSGTSGFAAGLVTQLRMSRTLTDISRYAVELYASLEAETGLTTGFKQTGSVSVASVPGRMDELRRMVSLGHGFGIEIHELSPREVGQLQPLMATDDLIGGVYIPKDGQTSPDPTTMALATAAITGGAILIENTKVTGIRHDGRAVTGVSTDRGEIDCEFVVICAGMWAREIGLLCGVKIPLHAAEHMHFNTSPIEGVARDMPSIRDPDGLVYFRRDIEDAGGILAGGFELEAKPWGMGGIPDDFSRMSPDWSRHRMFIDNAVKRIPVMGHAEIVRTTVGPESFTPDGHFVLGEAPGLKNLFVAAGFNSGGFSYAPGSGRAVAEWIVEGEPTMDLGEVDIRRFHGFENSPTFLFDRTVEGLGLVYAMHWPHRQPVTARDVRRSPVHERLAARGACFGVVAGWERPFWFAADGTEPAYEYSYGRQNWFPYAAKEHRAVRETVGLFDQSPFAKLLVQGRDAEAVVQRIFANDMSVPPGTVVYTPMLNASGGYEADLTVTRTAVDSYLVVNGPATATRTTNWIGRHIQDGAQVFLTDVTSAYGVLGVMGPESRNMLSKLTDTDLSNAAFPFGASREIHIGYATVRATRISYVGELGWELYIPTEFMTHVYDTIVGQGEALGLQLAGFHAMNSLRMEKAFRAWGEDVTERDTALEAGLSSFVAFDKGVEFIGREALLRQHEAGLKRRLAVFVIDDPEPLLLGHEPIYRDGRLVGQITSGDFGHTVDRSIGLGYVENEEGVNADFIRFGSYEIEILARRYSATVRLTGPHDPDGLRLRS
jgi:4-methylaminobutanoate oxidase (formaldehyde-forming)